MLEMIRNFLWVHPWWHATLVAVPSVLTVYFYWRNDVSSGQANELSVEANRLREESQAHVARIAELKEERNELQTGLNALQGERNTLLEKIACNTKQPMSEAERNAARLRKYVGQRAFISEGVGYWGGGAQIVELNDDNILMLFTPSGYTSTTATAQAVRCDELQVVEEPRDGFALQLRILKRYGDTQHLGEIRRWAERGGAANQNRSRGDIVFSADLTKQGSPERRGVRVYAPGTGNPQYTLVTTEDGEETAVVYNNNIEISKKCAVVLVGYRAEGFQITSSGSGGSPDPLFIYTH